jgi:uncharacterized protein YbjQ (UPF0145 family)
MSEDAAQAARSLEIIERGGIPPAATARLQENASRQGTPQHIFTSNLSPSEFLLTHEVGYEPLGQVMGTTAYHVGWQWMPGQTWGYYDPMTGLPPSQELGVITQAYVQARILAFSRLKQEAILLRADGVVGVRFERIQGGGLDPGIVEFKAVGTAVRRRGAPPVGGSDIFVSNLSGQDHWMLRSAGMKPVGFVFGNCVWYQVSNWRNQMLAGSWVNREFPDFTQGVYNARELAMERMIDEANHLRARGVVRVTIEPETEIIESETNNQSRRDLLVKFTIFGTAVDWETGRMPDLNVVPVVPLSDPNR